AHACRARDGSREAHGAGLARGGADSRRCGPRCARSRRIGARAGGTHGGGCRADRRARLRESVRKRPGPLHDAALARFNQPDDRTQLQHRVADRCSALQGAGQWARGRIAGCDDRASQAGDERTRRFASPARRAARREQGRRSSEESVSATLIEPTRTAASVPVGPPPPPPPGPIAQSVAIGFRVVYVAGLLLLAIWLMSNIRTIPSDSQAVVLRFGRIVRAQEAGLLVAWPRPIERVEVLPGPERQLSQ